MVQVNFKAEKIEYVDNILNFFFHILYSKLFVLIYIIYYKKEKLSIYIKNKIKTICFTKKIKFLR